MRKSRKKIIVAVLLITMLSQTLYSAGASILGVRTQSYAYADDEMSEEVQPGEDVDESTQDDADVVQSAPGEEASEAEEVTEAAEPATEEGETAGEGKEVTAPDGELTGEDKEVVGEDTKEAEEDEKEEAEAIRLRASYVDSETGSALKDTEDLEIDTDYLYIFKNEAPEIENFTYNKTTINIEDEEYDITAILTEDKDGTEVYSITTDEDIENKDTNDVEWTKLVKDAVVVFNYEEVKQEEEETVSDNEAVSENEAEESVSDNEAVSENEVSENEAEKRVYEYEDEKIKVTATLERADAVPDDAYFDVTPLTEEEAERYLAALNENLEEDQPEVTKDDILLYNIGFYTDESKSEEIEPEEGSVTINIEFKNNQLSEELGAETDEDLNVTHFEENGNDIDPVTVEAEASADGNTVDFTTDSFSVYGIWANRVVKNLKPGETVTYADVLGDAVNYGIVANTMHLDGHMESNFATGTLQGSGQIQACKNNGAGAGRVFIGNYDSGNKTFLMDKNGNDGVLYIYTTQNALDKMDPAMKNRSGVLVDTHTYSETQIKNMVEDMVDYVRTASDELMTEENCYQYSGLWANQWDNTVDLTDSSNPGGTYYISCDTSDGKAKNKFPKSGYTIKIRSDQNIVFNIPDSYVEIGQYKLNIDGKDYTPQGNSDEEVLFEKIIFNCPNATEVHTTSPVTGTFLVPRGDFYNDSVAAGFLVANNIKKIGGQEWHCISKNIEVIKEGETELDVNIKKILKDEKGNDVTDGGVWPSEGFTFKISRYGCTDPNDENKKDGNIIKDVNRIPSLPNSQVIVYKDSPEQTESFGRLKFKAKEVYDSSDAHVSGTYENTRYLCFMYKIEEVKGSASNIKYNDLPIYLKVFVNAQKIGNEYIVWTETKVAQTVTAGTQCQPGMPEMINTVTKPEYGTIEVTKELIRNGASSNDGTSYKVKLFGSGNSSGAYTWVDYTKVNVTSSKNRTVTRTYGEETTGNGNSRNVMYFDVQAGEKVTISNLPVTDGSADASYWVEEYFDAGDQKPEEVVYTNNYGFRDDANSYNGGVLNGGVTNMTTSPSAFNNGQHKASVTITNKYAYPKAAIEVTKEVSGLQTGETWPANGFGFKLEAGAETPNAPMPEGDAVKYATAANKTASWGEIEYPNTTADYWYQITEDIPAGAKEITVNNKKYMEDADGFLYDPEPYKVKVHVEKGTEPTATVTYYKNGSGSGTTSAIYTNLKKHPASYTPEAIKTIEGLGGDKEVTLTFDLFEGNSTDPFDSVTKTFKGSGDTPVAFKQITYTEAGEHTYRIVEQDSKGAATDPANAEITFKVVVSYDANGNLVAAAKDSSGNTLTAGAPVGTIKNIYTEDRPFVPVKKLLENRGMLSTDLFQIKVTQGGELVQGLTTKSDNDEFIALSNPVNIPTVAGQYESGITIYLPKYTYAQARAGKTDTYHFEEVRKGETINGVKYSTAEYDVKVTSYINDAGKIAFTIEGANDVSFTNTYSASGNAVIKGKKNLVGMPLAANAFSFTLSGNGIETQTVSNKADGTFEFAPIQYTRDMLEGAKEKSFNYKVSELKPLILNEGMTYSNVVYDVVVKVTDNYDGTLTTEVNDGGLFATGFTNTYKEEGEITFKVKKNMTNWPKGKEFTFYLYDGAKSADNLYDIVTITESDVDAATGEYSKVFKKIAAPEIVNGQPVSKTYTFEEKVVANDGVEYDAHPVKSYTVEWKSDGNGHIQAWKDGAVVNPNKEILSVSFTNSYTASGNFTPKVEKVLTNASERLKDFSFVLKDANKNQIGDAVTLTTDDEDGQVSLPTLTYRLSDLNQTNAQGFKTGEFTYYIAETAPDGAVVSGNTAYLDGITYDISDHELKATVTDNGHGGLDIAASGVGITATGLVTITNTYDANGKVILQAQKKVMDGEDENAEEIKDGIELDGTFEFELKDSSGNRIGDKKVTDSKGIVTFDEIPYTLADAGKIFTYTIEETAVNGKPYKKAADNVPQTVTVTVTDNHDGTISAIPSYRTVTDGVAKDELPVFKNILTGEGKVELKASKDLDGVIGVAKTFDFDLKEEGNTTPKQTKSITYAIGDHGKKSVDFDDLTYTIKDLNGQTSRTYYYQISERSYNDGIRYDPTTYAVKVTITLNSNGKFEVKKEVKKYSQKEDSWWTNLKNNLAGVFNGGDNDAIEFINYYKPHGDITFEGKKELTVPVTTENGLSLAGFEFEIKEGNTVVSSGTSAADGTISFNKIEYTEAGHHDYKVTEKDKNGFINNNGTKEFSVEVTDNGTGTLTVTPSENYQALLKFKNTPVELNISKKDITDETKELAGAKFELSGGVLKAPVEWTSNGSIKTIYGLAAGNYTLKETYAPDGFEVIAKEIQFSLSETGEVTIKETLRERLLGNDSDDVSVVNNVLTIKDEVKPITITKTDAGYQNTLPGAEFKLVKADGSDITADDGVVTENGGVFTITRLKAGSYKLVETKAPFGFAIADPIPFTINSTRVVTIDADYVEKARAVSAEDGNYTKEIQVADTPIEIYITKLAPADDGQGGTKALAGAKLEIQKYDDKSNTWTTKVGFTSTEAGKLTKVSDLSAGKYQLVETEAPVVTVGGKTITYKLADPVPFTISETGEVTGEGVSNTGNRYYISMKDEPVGTKSFHGHKTWVDGGADAKDRPEIQIELQRKYSDEAETAWTTVAGPLTLAAPSYEFSFSKDNDGKDLLESDQTGRAYAYRFKETVGETTATYVAVSGKTLLITDPDKDYEFKNSLSGNVTINVMKKWEVGGVSSDKIYEHFTATLQRTANGKTEILEKDFPVGKDFSVQSFGPYPKYDADGYEYTYEIIETKGSGNLYSWAGEYPQKVTGKAGADNTVSLNLINRHPEITPIPAAPEANKVVDSSTGVDQDKSGFEFGLYSKSGESYSLIESQTTDSSGHVKFSEVQYNENQVGEHVYYIHEIEPASKKAGYEYDPGYYPVYVTIGYNADHTALTSDVRYGADKSVNPVTITNKYNATGKFAVGVEKGVVVLPGDGSQQYYWPAGKSFTFRVTDTADNGDSKGVQTITLSKPENGNTTVSGNVSFAGYTKAGTHTYTISEVTNSETKVPGMTYAEDQTVTIKFKDDGNGKLVAYDISDGTEKEISDGIPVVGTFWNKYTASGEFTPEVKKVMKMATNRLTDFRFVLKDANKNQIGDIVTLTKDDSDGIVSLPKQTYNLADLTKVNDDGFRTDEFTYYIAEVAPNGAEVSADGKSASLNGITYDLTDHELKATVTDSGRGNLVVSASGAGVGDNTGLVTITNTYDAKGKVVLQAQKKVMNGEDENASEVFNGIKMDGTFEFTLKDAAGSTVDTKTTSANGIVTFKEIQYELKDAGQTYTYTIEETAKNVNGKPYKKAADNEAQTVTVTVTDNHDGTITARPSYTELPVFKNILVGEDKVELDVSKELKGVLGVDKTFTFELKEDGKANAIQTKTIEYKKGESGTKSVSFNKLSYGIKDLGGQTSRTFYYQVSEVKNNDGVQYSDAVYAVKVTISLDENGEFNLKKEIKKYSSDKDSWWTNVKNNVAGLFNGAPNDAIRFINSYAPRGEISFTGHKTLSVPDTNLSLAGFEFEIKEGNTVVSSGTSAADGTISFNKIEYTEAGHHDYKVTEKDKNGFINNNGTKEFYVDVIDNGSGTLKVTPSENYEAELIFTNTPVELKISKKDVTDETKELKGAQFRLTGGNINQNSPITWTSDGSIKTIYGLAEGNYRLEETFAPAGFELTQAVSFHLSKTGEVTINEGFVKKLIGNGRDDVSVEGNVLTIRDEVKPITITKTDAGYQNTLKGAEFKVVKANGSDITADDGVVTETDGVFTITHLRAGSYKLVETKAPFGYAVVDPILFTISSERLVTIDESSRANAQAVNEALSDGTYYTKEIQVADTPIEIFITKQAPADNGQGGTKALAGAKLEIQKYNDDTKTWTSVARFTSAEAGRISKVSELTAGEYQLIETEAPVVKDEQGNEITYKIADPVPFTISDNGVVSAEKGVTFENGIYKIAMLDEPIGKTNFHGHKEWVDGAGTNRPTIKIELQRKYSDEAETAWTTVAGPLTLASPYTFSFSKGNDGKDLLESDQTGRAYVYRFKEIMGQTSATYVAESGETLLITDPAADYTFKNSVSGNVTINVMKKWEVGGVSSDNIYEHFTATLQRTANGKTEILAKDFPVGKDFSVQSFGPYPKYDADGYEYTYEIIETKGSGNLYSWEGTYPQVVTGKAGTSDTVSLNLVNRHPEITPVPAAPEANKVVESTTGVAQDKSGFEFGLYKKVDDEYELIESKTTDSSGHVDFSTKWYNEDQVGEYVYYIHEKEPNPKKAGYEYDPNYYPVYVTIGYNADHTALTSDIKYGTQRSESPVVITNHYNAKGEFEIELSKDMQTLSGNAYWPEGATFDFEVTDNDGSKQKVQKVTLDKKNRKATVKFGPYTVVGDHEYKVTELDKEGNPVVAEATENGIRYAAPKTIKVTFTDDHEGNLVAKTDGSDTIVTSQNIEMVNKYTAKGKFTLKGKKVLNGDTISANGQYKVSISRNDLPDAVVVDVAQDGIWSFPAGDFTTFDLEKTEGLRAALENGGEKHYTYTVTEVNTGVDGVDYDTTVHTVDVTVKDPGNGTLTVVPDKKDFDITFVNTKPDPGKTSLNAYKTVSGMNLKDGEYSFTLEPDSSNGLGEVTKTDIKNAGNVVTYEFEYDNARTKLAKGEEKSYHYTAYETIPQGAEGGKLNGITYDTNHYGITVSVKNENGKLNATASFDGANQVSFKNTYDAKGGIDLTVGKQLLLSSDNETETELYPKEGFTFKLYDETGKELAFKTVKKKGDVQTFDGDYFKYDQEVLKNSEGKYDDSTVKYYYVKEVVPEGTVDGKKDGITYDTETAVIKVDIVKNGDKLDVTKSIRKTTEPVEKSENFVEKLKNFFNNGKEVKEKADVVFVNKLDREGDIVFIGEKRLKYLDGSTAPLVNEDNEPIDVTVISFIVKEGDTIVSTGTVDKEGHVTFTPIHYDTTGKHTYVVTEQFKEGVDPSTLDFQLEWGTQGQTVQVDVIDDPDNYGKLKPEVLNGNSTFSLVKEQYEVDGKIYKIKGSDDVAYDTGINFTCINPLVETICIRKDFDSAITSGIAEFELSGEGRKIKLTFDASKTDKQNTYAFNIVKNKTSESDTLQAGTYDLKEIKGPAGAELAPDRTITIRKDGKYDLVIHDGKETTMSGVSEVTPVVVNNSPKDMKYAGIEVEKNWKGLVKGQVEHPPVTVIVRRGMQSTTDAGKKVYTAVPGDNWAGVKLVLDNSNNWKASIAKASQMLPAEVFNQMSGKYEEVKYYVEEVKVPGYLSTEPYLAIAANGTDPDVYMFEITNTVEQKPVEIPVKKVWKDGKNLAAHPAITFHLFADSGNGKKEVNSLVLPTGQTEAKFTRDQFGKELPMYDEANGYKVIEYTVTEDPVAGYKPGQAVQNADGSWTFTNESIKADIIKYDANDVSARPTELKGAKFVIEKTDKSWKANFQSGQNLEVAIGSSMGGITPGDYTMNEIEAPEGYALSSVTAHFTIGKDGKVTQTDKWLKSNWRKDDGICFEDKPLYGEIRIIKEDGDTQEPLEGAEFKLYSTKPYTGKARVVSNYIAGENVLYEVAKYTTDSDGSIIISDLPWDTYYLEETKAPDGYALTDYNTYIFVVNEKHNTPGNADYQKYYYIANYEETPPPPPTTSSSSSTTTTSSSSTTTTSSSSRTSTSTSSPTTTSSSTRTPGTSSPSSSGRYLTGGVLGERKPGFVSNVLGSKEGPNPKAGVLGERMSPVTGDDLTLNFWIMVLCAAGLIAMSFVYSDDEEEENGDGTKKKKRGRRARKAKK